jgi:hypothetical protein
MTRVKVTYVAMDLNGYKPIMTASTFEDLRVGLDDYYGVHKGEAECWGWNPYEGKFPDEYEGYFTYAWKNVTRDEVTVVKDKVKVYCIEYHPFTTYEV